MKCILVEFPPSRICFLFNQTSLGVTLGISIVGGAITGFIMNVPLWEQLENEEYFEDGKYWEMDVYQVQTNDEDAKI